MKNFLLLFAFAIGMMVQAQISMDLPSVSKIMIEDNATVEIRYSPTSKIQFSGSQQEFNDRVVADSELLMIKGNSSTKPVRARIYTSSLDAIQIAGNANVTVEGFSVLDRLNVYAKDNGELDLGKIKINSLLVEQNGSSKVSAPGAKNTRLIKDGVLTATN